MSEKIFACLLRLYPVAFREKYQKEVLQFYQDRLRDESGTFLRMRLYRDLLVDALSGIPQAWRNSYPENSAPLLAIHASGMPSFHLLDRKPLSPASIIAGGVFSFTVLVAFGLVMRLPAPHPRLNSNAPRSPVEAVLERLNRAVSAPAHDGERSESTGRGVGASQAQANSSSATAGSITPDDAVSASERAQVIQAVAENMAAHYFDPQKGRLAAERIRTQESGGAHAGIADGGSLAGRLTADLRSATGDSHLDVAYSRNVLPNAPDGFSATSLERYRAMLIRQNCTVEDVEILANKIGYLKIDSFPDMEICGATLRKALARVGQSDAIVFDLRDNAGGFPETVAALAAPLFDRAVPWYNPRANPTSTMLAPAAGSRLADTPVYILTSSRTYSAAEHFTYNLKMLKRATVIGETTGGAAHTGVFHRVDEHFGVGIPEARISNPYGGPDWAGVGVEPDVKVKAADALGVAEKLAAKRVRR